MNKEIIDAKKRFIKGGTIVMILYAVFMSKIKNTALFQKLICPKDTILINTKSFDNIQMLEKDTTATIIQTAVRSKLLITQRETTETIDTKKVNENENEDNFIVSLGKRMFKFF